MSENIPKEHIVFNENPYEYVDHHEVKIGDTIINITSNQDAFGIYSVVKSIDDNGIVEKSLEKINSTPSKKLSPSKKMTPSKKLTPLKKMTSSKKLTSSKKMTPSKEFTPLKESNKEFSNIIFHFFPDDGSRGGKKKHKQTQYKRTRKQRSKSKSKNMKSKKYRRTKK